MVFGIDANKIAETAKEGSKVLRDINDNIARTQRNFQEIVQTLQGFRDELKQYNERLAKVEEAVKCLKQ